MTACRTDGILPGLLFVPLPTGKGPDVAAVRIHDVPHLILVVLRALVVGVLDDGALAAAACATNGSATKRE